MDEFKDVSRADLIALIAALRQTVRTVTGSQQWTVAALHSQVIHAVAERDELRGQLADSQQALRTALDPSCERRRQ